MSNQVFNDLVVLADMPEEIIKEKLIEIEAIDTYEDDRGLFEVPAWKYRQHAFGYLPTTTENEDRQIPIKAASNIHPDETLKGTRIKITLDRMMIANYPGWGDRSVLFNFSAKHSTQNHIEQINFNQVYEARDGQLIGVQNIPIFIGLIVDQGGIDFKCITVNVKNRNDENALKFLDSDTMKAGLSLVATAQPAIAPLASMALGITKMVSARNKNVAVQKFSLGLDFSNTLTGARLREGSYIAVQCGPDWSWGKWLYDRQLDRIVNKLDPSLAIPYNYIVFGISRLE